MPRGNEGTLDGTPFPPGGRVQLPFLKKSPWLLWTREGNSAAVYGCVTFSKLLNLSVPQFCHVTVRVTVSTS